MTKKKIGEVTGPSGVLGEIDIGQCRSLWQHGLSLCDHGGRELHLGYESCSNHLSFLHGYIVKQLKEFLKCKVDTP